MSSSVSEEDTTSQDPKELRRRKIKLALILAAVAISLYVLSIVSIISSRGGVV